MGEHGVGVGQETRPWRWGHIQQTSLQRPQEVWGILGDPGGSRDGGSEEEHEAGPRGTYRPSVQTRTVERKVSDTVPPDLVFMTPQLNRCRFTMEPFS